MPEIASSIKSELQQKLVIFSSEKRDDVNRGDLIGVAGKPRRRWMSPHFAQRLFSLHSWMHKKRTNEI
jgi:hypothetical protein